jgi:hypothetical protein
VAAGARFVGVAADRESSAGGRGSGKGCTGRDSGFCAGAAGAMLARSEDRLEGQS